jgi:hypothetical protein
MNNMKFKELQKPLQFLSTSPDFLFSSQNSAAEIWSSSRLVCQGTSHPTKDGTHLTGLPLLWVSSWTERFMTQ